MRKQIVCLLLAAVCCFGLALAEAELPEPAGPAHKTITAIATEVNPEHLCTVAVNARIIGYSSDENTLTIELIVPEVFDWDDVRGLAAGDAIYTQGHEVIVKTFTENGSYLVINEGEYEFSEGSVWLYENPDFNYQIAEWDDNTWSTLATIEVPASDALLFLDHINPSSGEALPLPAVHPAAEFLSMMRTEEEEGGPGFAVNNVYVVFDRDGQLAAIHRYYVPWQ